MAAPEYTEVMIRTAELRFMVTVLEATQRDFTGVVGATTGLTVAIRALRARVEHLERLDQAL